MPKAIPIKMQWLVLSLFMARHTRSAAAGMYWAAADRAISTRPIWRGRSRARRGSGDGGSYRFAFEHRQTKLHRVTWQRMPAAVELNHHVMRRATSLALDRAKFLCHIMLDSRADRGSYAVEFFDVFVAHGCFTFARAARAISRNSAAESSWSGYWSVAAISSSATIRPGTALTEWTIKSALA